MNVTLVRPLINERKNSPFFLPLSLLTIAAPLRARGISLDIVDFEFEYRRNAIDLPCDATWLEDFVCRILRNQPAVVGITTLADTLPQCVRLGSALRQTAPNTRVVLGGPGVFSVTAALLKRYGDSFDYICINEGEIPFLHLCESLNAGLITPIPGMLDKSGDVSAERQSFSNLDDLPRPAYELLPVAEYLELSSPRVFDVYVGTGCTYACTFCITAPFWNRTFRAKSPDLILAELDYLNAAFGISRFNFIHDNFSNDKQYLTDFIQYFHDNNTKYEWGCAVRPDNVNPQLLADMKRAGCFRVFVGLDAGSERILRDIHKLPNSSRSYAFFTASEEAGIEFEANTIIGYPDESSAEFEESMTLVFDALAHGAVASDVSVLQPLPGAPITLANADFLEFVESPETGSFCPSDVLQLARQGGECFPGFYFIRKGNQPYAWYRTQVDAIRFLGREWFNTVYFMHEYLGLTYTQVLEQVSSVAQLSDYDPVFRHVVTQHILDHPLGGLLESVYVFDDALRSLRVVDTAREVENIYHVPSNSERRSRYAVARTEYAVHGIVGKPRQLDVPLPQPKGTHYLFSTVSDDGVQIMSLSKWQVRLLRVIQGGENDASVMNEIVANLSSEHALQAEEVRNSVAAVASRLKQIVACGDAV